MPKPKPQLIPAAPASLADLKPAPYNPRSISPAAAAGLGEAMRLFGDLSGIVFNTRTGNLVAGHQRREQLEKAGGKYDSKRQAVLLPNGEAFPVRLVDWDEATEKAANLTANNPAIAGVFTPETAQLLAEVKLAMPAEFAAVNLGGLELPATFGNETPPEGMGEDTPPEDNRAAELRDKYAVEAGQVWQLGDHRLACGDCTDIEVVKRAMGGDKARLCFTSPPYADQREYEIGEFNWLQLANGFTDCVFQILADPSDFVVNLGMSYKDGRVNFYWDKWLRENEAKGRWLYGWYVWDKIFGAFGDFHGRLSTAHEFLFHFSHGRNSANKWIETKYTEESIVKERERHARGGGREGRRQPDGSIKKLGSIENIGQSHKIPESVVRIMKEQARSLHTETHPAVFPVALPEFMMQTWSNPGDVVYEPFCGSGTSIIAAQNLGRKCRAVEISPNYVAVALERWARHTGQEPVLL